MIGVKVRPHESIDKALRRFSKMTEPNLAEYKKKMMFYEKPSVEKHRKDSLQKRENEKRRLEAEKIRKGIMPKRKFRGKGKGKGKGQQGRPSRGR